MDFNMLNEALRYAAAGWSVMPLYPLDEKLVCTCHKKDECKSAGKHPIPANGLKDATTDPDQIQRWWAQTPDANIGVRTGATGSGGVIVLDVDPKHGGDESLVRLQQERGNLPATYTVQTGSDGLHLYFRHPGFPTKNRAHPDGYAGIDMRADEGLVVVPPSLHFSGNHYTARRDASWIAEAPDYVKEWVRKTDADSPTPFTPEDYDGNIPRGTQLVLAGNTHKTLERRIKNRDRTGLTDTTESAVDYSISVSLAHQGVPGAQIMNTLLWSHDNAGLARKHQRYYELTVGKALGKFETASTEIAEAAAAVDMEPAAACALLKEVQSDFEQGAGSAAPKWGARVREVASAAHSDSATWLAVRLALLQVKPAKLINPFLKGVKAEMEKLDALKQEAENMAAKATRMTRQLEATQAENQEIAKLNERYGFMIIGGRDIVVDTKSAKFDFMETRAFQRLMDKYVIIDPETLKEKRLGSYWVTHIERRDFVGFDFSSSGTKPNHYNLFRGFKFPEGASKGTQLIFYDHLLMNVCQGDEKLYAWILAWMARLVQNPEKMSCVALVLRGLKGVGKSIVFEVLRHLFVSNTLLVSDPRHVVGNFNKHLMDCVLLVADEGFWAGDKRHEGALKRLITQPDLAVEIKGKDVFDAPNHVSLGVTSNEDWVVPTSADERRFTVVTVGDQRRQDGAYFKDMMEELKNGGYEELYNVLRTLPLEKYPDPTKFYNTKALLQQTLQGLDPIENWWYRSLMQGALVRDDDGKWASWNASQRVPIAKVLDEFAKQTGTYQRRAQTALPRKLRQMCPSMKGGHGETTREGRTFYELPELSAARAEFERYIGAGPEIWS